MKPKLFPLFSSWLGQIIILLGITFLNFWIWKIIGENRVVAVILVLLSILLFKLIIGNSFRRWILIGTLVLLIIISYLTINNNFDGQLSSLTPDEKIQLNERHFYYSKELGALFLNSIVLNLYKNYSLNMYKFERNLFSNLDINLYFFASHPRERPGIDEFEKYTVLFLPFFVIGIIVLISWGSLWALSYLLLASLISGFVDPKYSLGPILFFPFINVSIALGIIYFPKLIKKIKQNLNER